MLETARNSSLAKRRREAARASLDEHRSTKDGAESQAKLQAGQQPIFGRTALVELWREGHLCDVTLRAGRVLVPAHRVVLAACSPFFRAMFTRTGDAMLEGRCDVIDLKGVDGSTLKEVLEALYTQELHLSEDNVQNLLSASIYLDLGPVQRQCREFLLSHLDVSTCLDTMVLASTYGCDDLYAEARRFAAKHFPELLVVEGGRAFFSLPIELLTALLESDDLRVEAEVEAVRAAVQWAQHAPNQRQPLLASVLGAVRLALIPLALLQHEVACHPTIQHSQGCLKLVHDAIDVHTQPELLNFDEKPKRRDWATGRLIAVGGHDEAWRSLRSVELYDPLTDTWEAGPPMDGALSFVGSARVNGELYVMGGSTFCNTVLRIQMQSPVSVWEQMVPLNVPRVHAGCVPDALPFHTHALVIEVAELGGALYVAGGRYGHNGTLTANLVERFEVSRDAWEAVAEMNTPRSSLGAAGIDGELYVVGGQGGRSTYRTCEVYNAARDQWRPLAAQMQTERKYLGVCTLEGRIFAMGGMNEQRARLASMETYDPREGRWTLAAPMTSSRSSFGVSVLDGRLYVAGGGGGDEGTCYESVECFCPFTNRWHSVASLGLGRSGLTLAAVC